MLKIQKENPQFKTILKAGPLNICFKNLRKEYQNTFIERYSHFMDGAQISNLTIEIEEKEIEFLKDETGYLRFKECLEEGRKVLYSNIFKGFIADEKGVSVIIISAKSNETLYITSLENHLRWVVSNELMKRGGFLLHSGGIAKGAECSLFFGSSGDGKSTIVELGKGRGGKVLSDDLIIVSPEKGGYFAWGAPFYGVLPQKEKEKKSYKIKSLYRIRKSDKTYVKEISKGAALGLIVSQCQFIFNQRARNEILVPNVIKFLEKVPCYELYFKKNDSFWDLI